MFLLYHNDILRKSIFYKFQNKTYISNEIQVSVLPRGNTFFVSPETLSISTDQLWMVATQLFYFVLVYIK